MPVLTAFLPDEAATMAAGAALAPLLRRGDVVALHGDLGAGKTTLVRGIIQTLCGAGTETPSPTFTLVQTYDTPAGLLWHYDLYRLDDPTDLEELGWDETADGILLTEWPDKAGSRLPSARLDVILSPEENGRIIRLQPQGSDWETRLELIRDQIPGR